jgi:hypothetical protein
MAGLFWNAKKYKSRVHAKERARGNICTCEDEMR